MILDCVGGSRTQKHSSPCHGQSLGSFRLMGGRRTGRGTLGTMLRKRASIRGTTLRTRSPSIKMTIDEEMAVVASKIESSVDSKFNFDKV